MSKRKRPSVAVADGFVSFAGTFKAGVTYTMQACPVCNGEGKVFRMTAAFEAMATASSNSFGWSGPTHEWRTCPACSGSGIVLVAA